MSLPKYILFLACVPNLLGQAISFLPPTPAGIGGLYYPVTNLSTADFNGDGKMDLIALNPQIRETNVTPFTLSLGKGDGTFQNAQTLVSGDNIRSPVIADFNGDGKLDIAIIQSTPIPFPPNTSLTILLGNGDGTFHAGPVTPLVSSITTLITADFNHDGHPDLIAGQTILLGNGDGTFRALPVGLDAPPSLSSDFNRDGKPDLLLVLASGQLAVALGVGDGTFGMDLPVTTPFVVGSFTTADFNGDGLPDLAVSPAQPDYCILECSFPVVSIAVLKGNGDGTFQAPLMSANSMGAIFAAADINHDGRIDLVVGNSVLAGVGDGTFQFPVPFGLTRSSCAIYPDYACQVHSNGAVVADFNNDGALDIVETETNWDGTGRFSLSGVVVLLNDSPGDGFIITGVSSPSYKWPVAAASMVTAFGINLAPETASAQDETSPPTTLGGIRVHLVDSVMDVIEDHLAPLFYVSPGQINFEVSTTDTFVYISIEHVGSPYVPKGMIIPVQPLQPDLYTLASSDVAAATAVQVSGNGNIASVSVAPINLSGGPVYLSLYGTGFDAVLTDNSTCTIAGVSVQPTYSGPQLQIPGLDQINLLLPTSLAGFGAAAVQCSFGPAAPSAITNTVHVAIH